jgi:hypothetical protein
MVRERPIEHEVGKGVADLASSRQGIGDGVAAELQARNGPPASKLRGRTGGAVERERWEGRGLHSLFFLFKAPEPYFSI